MLRFYDQRFAHDSNFLFYNFSQEMRHDACREVARVKDTKHMQKFKEILNQPDLEQRLRYAIKHPGSDLEKETVRFNRARATDLGECVSGRARYVLARFKRFARGSFESDSMDKELSQYYMFPGQQIGWSAQERANVKSRMYAYMQTYGPANWFITVSPSMTDNWLTQKLMQRQTHDMTDDGRDADEWKPNEAPSLEPRCTHSGDTRRQHRYAYKLV